MASPSRKRLKKWACPNPEKCDLCGKPIGDFFIDGAVGQGGPWGCLCPSCHDEEGIGLGVGSGQFYWRVGDQFYLIAGGFGQ